MTDDMNFNEVAGELIAMSKEDQEMRERAMQSMDSWDATVDHKNTARLKTIVDKIGWLTVSKVGTEASRSAWLLVQHATNESDFMRHCLELMKTAPEGDVSPANMALLEDRLLTMDGKPQIYGTQFRMVDGVTEPFPIEDFEHIDVRRKQVGLDPFAEYEARIMAR